METYFTHELEGSSQCTHTEIYVTDIVQFQSTLQTVYPPGIKLT